MNFISPLKIPLSSIKLKFPGKEAATLFEKESYSIPKETAYVPFTPNHSE
jgi:hypothetical protein